MDSWIDAHPDLYLTILLLGQLVLVVGLAKWLNYRNQRRISSRG